MRTFSAPISAAGIRPVLDLEVYGGRADADQAGRLPGHALGEQAVTRRAVLDEQAAALRDLSAASAATGADAEAFPLVTTAYPAPIRSKHEGNDGITRGRVPAPRGDPAHSYPQFPVSGSGR